MRCEELMKKNVACCNEQEAVQTAAKLMRDQNVGFIPVCNSDGKVLGTITDRDITIRLVADNTPPANTRCGTVMTREVVYCKPDDELAEAEQLMARYQKSRILVCDEQKKLLGVISLSDIAERESDGALAQTLRRVASREVSVQL